MERVVEGRCEEKPRLIQKHGARSHEIDEMEAKKSSRAGLLKRSTGPSGENVSQDMGAQLFLGEESSRSERPLDVKKEKEVAHVQKVEKIQD